MEVTQQLPEAVRLGYLRMGARQVCTQDGLLSLLDRDRRHDKRFRGSAVLAAHGESPHTHLLLSLGQPFAKGSGAHLVS